MNRDDGLGHLVQEGIIDAVHARLMSGKEATVYVVEREGHFGAAKVYKARDERTFKKTASYTEGRNQTRNTRDHRAMQNKTAYGRKLIETGWQDMEFAALRAAFDAGVRVPEPYFIYENVLFMELIVDEHGVPAARLVDFSFTPDIAAGIHLEIFLQVKKLLGIGRIHGDLSAYNILMAGKGLTIIDMPQIVDVAGNNNARSILRRDLRNVTEHLARFDARLLRFVDCGNALFNHLVSGTLDMVVGPEVGGGGGSSSGRGGGAGRRGRDAERGRAGRDKSRGGQGRQDVGASTGRTASEPARPTVSGPRGGPPPRVTGGTHAGGAPHAGPHPNQNGRAQADAGRNGTSTGGTGAGRRRSRRGGR